MIYLDTSAALAQLFSQTRRPPASLWRETLVSSRLLEYEAWTRVHATGRADVLAEPLRELLGKVALVEMSAEVLARVTEPFPVAVRTLDAIHLATIEFLRAARQDVRLASYDLRMVEAATALGVQAEDLA